MKHALKKEDREQRDRLWAFRLKKCKACGKILSSSKFRKKDSGFEGLYSLCRSCDAEWSRNYNKTPAGSAARKLTYERRKKKSPEKRIANSAVTCAINRGDMFKAAKFDCVECGRQAAEYHHDQGYEKEHWLDVVPLCVPCHKRIHLKSENGTSVNEHLTSASLIC